MKTINYITYDAWWDTDISILPSLCKHYTTNVFVSNPVFAKKFLVKEVSGCNKFEQLNEYFRDRNPLKMGETLKFFFKILKVCRKRDTLNIFIYGRNPYLLLLCLLFLPQSNTIIAAHNFEEHSDNRKSFFARFKRLFYKRFSSFLFFSDLERLAFSKKHPQKESFVLNMPIKDFGKATELREYKKPTFLFFGMIREYKRLDLYIEAANNISQGAAKFVIAGNAGNSYWDKCKAKIKNACDFQCDIKFIDNADIPNYFCNADCIVLPYDDATQSGPMMIALNYGLPIIASSLESFKKIVTDGYNGYIFQRGSATELTSALKKIIDMPLEEREKMKSNCTDAREKYIKNNDICSVVSNIFEKVVTR